MAKHLFSAVLMWASMTLVVPASGQTSGAPLPPSIASAGVTRQQWDAVVREVHTQAQRAQISEAALLAAAESAGANFARSGRFDPLSLQGLIIEQLSERADQIAELQRRIGELLGEANSAEAQDFAQARAAINEGRLADADRLLAQVGERDLAEIRAADGEIERRRLRVGETIAARGQVAYVQANYIASAEHYARAAETVPQSAISARWRYTLERAKALYTQGDLFGEPARVLESIQAYRNALTLASRDERSEDWARTQWQLSNALLAADGRAGSGRDETWQSAIAAARAAQEVFTRANAPARWSDSQHNIGIAFWEGGDPRSAIEAFRLALEVRTRSSEPYRWGATQNALGLALLQLPGRKNTPAAIEAFEAALQVHTEQEYPEDWATAQHNLALAYEGMDDDHSLRLAIEHYRAALRVYTLNAAPGHYATTMNTLARVYLTLGQRGDARAFQTAVEIHRQASSAYSRSADPTTWAAYQNNFAATLAHVGQQGDARVLAEAIRLLRETISIGPVAAGPILWRSMHMSLGFALLWQNRIASDNRALRDSIVAFRTALETTDRTDEDWASIQEGLGDSLTYFGYGGGGRSALQEAVQHYRAALQTLTPQSNPATYRNISDKLQIVEQSLRRR